MKKPTVFLIAAITADGFIAKTRYHFADWTSKEDKKKFVELTKEAGAMIMGSTTFSLFPAPLKGRKHYVYTSKTRQSDDDQVVFTSKPPRELIDSIAAEGFKQIAIIGGQHVYDLFLTENLIDEVYLTVEPKLFGSGITLTTQLIDTDLALIRSTNLGEHTVMLHYRVVK